MTATGRHSGETAWRLWSGPAHAAEFFFAVVLFLLAFLPRAIYPVARSTNWHQRASTFVQAVSQRDWAATLLAPHPGVTAMWLAGIANWLGSALIPDFDQQLLHRRMAVELLPLVLIISLAIVLAYFLLTRVFDRQVAVVSTLLLALDPFHISISKTVHVDALMSVFVMLSALCMLVFVGEARLNRRRYILLSGTFAGLAVLSKAPSLFLAPYIVLCLAACKLSECLQAADRVAPSLSKWRGWVRPAGRFLSIVSLWVLALSATYWLLYPSMWVQPGKTLNMSFSMIGRSVQSPHRHPILFLGQVTTEDPGSLFYPVNLLLKTTAISLPCFFVGLVFLFDRRLDRRQRLALLLAVAFVVLFTVQMTMGRKKDVRYNLPAFQFVDVVAGFGAVHALRWLMRGRRWLLNVALSLVVAGQSAVSIPRHPYYGTHYNRILGTPRAILEGGTVPGQGQGEGLDLAAAYLNELPMSPLLVVGAQVSRCFSQYFEGETVRMTDDKADYLVFARNWVMRGVEASQWESLWETYKERRPKLVVEFDDVPYVWVYKVSPLIDETTVARPVDALIGQDFRLLGYDLEPGEPQPGETVHLSLYWEAIQKPTGDYTVFAHLLDPSGHMRGQKDNQPQGGMYPTYLWDEGERVEDRYELVIACDAPPGAYQIAMGMYYLPTLRRLPVTDDSGSPLPDDRVMLPGPEVREPSE